MALFRQGSSTGERHCPACDRRMERYEVRGVEIDICPGCRGVWFEAGELPRMAGLAFEDAPSARELASAQRSERRCPSCALWLYERELGPDSGVMVDQCVQCSGLFLDHGEFTRLLRHFGGHDGGGLRGRPVQPEPVPKVLDGDSLALVFLQYMTGVPLELDTPQVVFPPAVLALIAVNVVVLIVGLAHGLQSSVLQLGMVPAQIRAGWRLWTLLTSMFMHGGPFHLIGNMLFLYILGDNLELRFGWWRFVVFYLLCGLVANLAYAFCATQPQIPSVGASGAVSGVLGAYLVLWPRRRLLVRLFYFLWLHSRIEVPVWVYLGFWILVQLALAQLDVPGVAWMAHVGGFTCGLVVGLFARWVAGGARIAPRWLGG